MDYGTTLSCVRRLSPRPDRPDGPRARTWTIVADDFDAFVAGLGLE